MLLPHRRGQKGGHNGTHSPRDATRMPYAPEASQPHAGVADRRGKTHLPPHKRYHPSASLRHGPGTQHAPLALSRRDEAACSMSGLLYSVYLDIQLYHA